MQSFYADSAPPWEGSCGSCSSRNNHLHNSDSIHDWEKKRGRIERLSDVVCIASGIRPTPQVLLQVPRSLRPCRGELALRGANAVPAVSITSRRTRQQ